MAHRGEIVSLRRLKHREKHPNRRRAPLSSPFSRPVVTGSPQGARLWFFRLTALTVIPLLLLGTTELALRVAGYGYATSFFKPVSINGVACLVENDQFGLRFFPPPLARSPAPVVMRAEKPPGRYRIFLLGESAALGDPAPAFGVGRYLQTLLRERFPEADFEVVCVAMTAINSHALLPIARECARRDGDLWVVYMGNNEMVGPFGAATVFGAKAPSRWLVRLRLSLGRLRLMQALTDLSHWVGAENRNRTWEGMKLFIENQLAPDHPARETVYRNFRANLEDLLQAAQRAGVPVVLSTVAVNLRDFAPLAALPGRVGTNPPPEFARLVTEAVTAQAAGDWSSAVRAYEQAAQISPRHADVQFRLGQCHLALANRREALARFSQARDDDALPFRADSRVNAIIREAGESHTGRGVHPFDAESVLAAHNPDGIPGDESFYEHVHLTFDGNYRLARALAEAIVPRLPERITRRTTADWATQEECERRLGLSDWNRRDVLDNMLRRLAQPPFAGQPDNARRLKLWRNRLNETARQLTPANAGAARSLHLEAIRRDPEDFRLHWNFADFLEATRDLPGALAAWRKVQSLIPHHHVAYYQLGRLHAELGQRVEARRALEQAVARRPDLGAGWFELGLLDLAEDRPETALRHFARARSFAPQDARIAFQSALALARLQRQAEAVVAARDALRLDPDFHEARLWLGAALLTAGQPGDARAELEAGLKLRPDHPLLRLNLGKVLLQQGLTNEALREFEEALRLDPNLRAATESLEKLKSPSPPPP